MSHHDTDGRNRQNHEGSVSFNVFAPATRLMSETPPRVAAHLTVDELAAATGVTVRNIRAYQTSNLLEPPVLQGRLALYGRRHQARLELIRELRALGFGLDAIGDMLAQVPQSAASPYALLAQMFSRGFFQVEQPALKSLTDLTAHWSETATPEQIERMVRNGLYRPVPPDEVPRDEALADDATPQAPVFEVLSPSLWAIGQQMAELNIPLPTVLDMQEKLIEHTRALARAYVDQFVIAMVREVLKAQKLPPHDATSGEEEPPLSPQLLRTIHRVIERLRPIAIGSVSAAFPVVLQQEFDRDVVHQIQALVKQVKDQAP